MSRFWNFLIDRRTLAVIGFLALAGLLLGSARVLKLTGLWLGILLAVAGLVWLGVWLYRRRKSQRSAEGLGEMLEQQGQTAVGKADATKRPEVEALRSRLREAVQTIKTSRLGQSTGAAALYELPWYMIIGNPAAGKSTVVANSGLKFPYADKGPASVQGVGGTRNCDWFFTSDGIIIDTAGRYTMYAEDRSEWLSFLDLLKKHRTKAPINGILIAASIPDLTGNKPESVVNLAKNLRMRLQELTEKLEVFAPVYLLFTKSDLIPGFLEFFANADPVERDRVWGASLPYSPEKPLDPVSSFEEKFEQLHEGLKEKSLAEMGLNRGRAMPTGYITFPLEFAAIKPALTTFVATLFEENPYQFRPVFRGFYFTSALQEGIALKPSTDRIAQRFTLPVSSEPAAAANSRTGYFLLELFRKVVFPDQNLVKQYASSTKQRWRTASFLAVVALLGIALAGWSFSFAGNRRLVANVQADLGKAVKLQEGRFDLQSRLDAMAILQDRIVQLERYGQHTPIGLGLGLYQGDALLAKLKAEYFHGISQIMLIPVGQTIEAFLDEVNANASKLTPTTGVAASKGGTYKDASPTSTEDAYNALKTYLMLANRERAEQSHLTDQVTRFWRSWLEANRGNMPREQMIRTAEQIINFYVLRIADPDWPTLQPQLTTVDLTRETLVKVVAGTPARERVYAQIRARAAVQFPPMTVPRILPDEADAILITGSYSVSGAFTKEAWTKYVQAAIKEASTKESQSKDWVLNVGAKDDLTLQGSPEQIEKDLTLMYKNEYAEEWVKFVQGINLNEFKDFAGAVAAMNRLGDPKFSPILRVVSAVYDNTGWDNPNLLNEGLSKARRGVLQWFKEAVLRQAPGSVDINLKVSGGEKSLPLGPIGKKFELIAEVMASKDGGSYIKEYTDGLAKIRTRFNKIKLQGDYGPGAKLWMMQTLEGTDSEIADTQRRVDDLVATKSQYVDESGAQRVRYGGNELRAILSRPLLSSFAVIAKPTEVELNQTWAAQVLEPFNRQLAGKYPFTAAARIEAAPSEIALVFGPAGAIAKFVNESLARLVVRHGDSVAVRTWADIGITLSPEFLANLPRWIAGNAAPGGGDAAASAPQVSFQMQALPAAGLAEYSIEIDGQLLRYRNTPPQWANFVWPNAGGVPGAKVTAISFDGRSVEVANQPGRAGLERLIQAADKKKLPDNITELTWSNGSVKVSANLRVISNTQANASNPDGAPQQGLKGVKLPAAIAGSAFAPTAANAGNAAAGAEAPATASPAGEPVGGKQP